MRLTPFIFLILLSFTTSLIADSLIITGSLVNLRESPSSEAPILLKLAQGRIATATQHQRGWVEIRIDHPQINSGWVHESLVSYISIHQDGNTDPVVTKTSVFEIFMGKFEQLNQELHNQSGFIPFTGADIINDDTITVTATPDWFTASQKLREDILSAVFELWSDAVKPGVSITVQVLDENNEYHMVMFR